MSATELNALEVELTRARFASDLARLRSIAEFKEDLWAQARETKEGVLADLKGHISSANVSGVTWRIGNG